MLLTTSIRGRSIIERETLYDGEVCLLDKKQGRVKSITSCFVYEMHFKIRYDSDLILLEAGFIVELTYEHIDESGTNHKEIKKLSCHKSLFPNISTHSGVLAGNEQLHIIPVIHSIIYRYQIWGNGLGIRLIISASMECIATTKYYSNILECEKELPEPEYEPQAVSWQSVIDSISFNDVLAFFESFIRLLKTSNIFKDTKQKQSLDNGTGESGINNENQRLLEIRRSLEEKIQANKDYIAHLQSELREREDIIGKLLTLLDRE